MTCGIRPRKAAHEGDRHSHNPLRKGFISPSSVKGGAFTTEATSEAPPPRAAAQSPVQMIKLINWSPHRWSGAWAVKAQLAPVVLVRVVIAVPSPAAGAESQSAVVAIGHTAERVGLGSQGGHIGSPGGAA